MNEEIKKLVEKYCLGSVPTEEQENEIMGKALDMDEDTDKVLEYMEECKQKKAMPVEKIKEESQAKEKKKEVKAEPEKSAEPALPKKEITKEEQIAKSSSVEKKDDSPKEKKSSPSAAVKQKKGKKDNKTTPASKKRVAAKKEVLDVDKLFEESEGNKDVGGHFDLFSDEPLIEDGCDEKDFDPVKIFAPIVDDKEVNSAEPNKKNSDEQRDQSANLSTPKEGQKGWMRIDPLWLIAILCFLFVLILVLCTGHV